MKRSISLSLFPVCFTALILLVSACGDAPQTDESAETDTTSGSSAQVDSSQLVTEVTGFSGPEAVRYDPDQDVYFVSNFNGEGGAEDNNGFISRVSPDGSIEELEFIAGGQNDVTLHAPRGMAITGDTLWAADAGAVRGFHKSEGNVVATYDFSAWETGFLNDVIPGPDGAIYVTDTGQDRVYRLAGRDSIAVLIEDPQLGSPNGITWDEENSRFIVVPYGGSGSIYAFEEGDTTLTEIGSSTGAQYDGVEVLDGGRILVASQADSSLHVFEGQSGQPTIKTGGKPADIGVDTQRNRVAVPFIARNLVEIWQLPEE